MILRSGIFHAEEKARIWYLYKCAEKHVSLNNVFLKLLLKAIFTIAEFKVFRIY